MTVMTPDHGCSPRGTTCAMRTRIQYQWSVLEMERARPRFSHGKELSLSHLGPAHDDAASQGTRDEASPGGHGRLPAYGVHEAIASIVRDLAVAAYALRARGIDLDVLLLDGGGHAATPPRSRPNSGCRSAAYPVRSRDRAKPIWRASAAWSGRHSRPGGDAGRERAA